MPAVTLKFHVTKRTPAPVYPDPVFPVDPVTSDRRSHRRAYFRADGCTGR